MEMNAKNIFGDSVRVRAIDYLAKHSEEPIYPKMLAKEIDATPAGVTRALEPLVSEGLVISKKMGNMNLYSINRRNQSIASLIEFLKE